jgi:protein-L-isoaspartate(D-aspartate) O-methyltransferase
MRKGKQASGFLYLLKPADLMEDTIHHKQYRNELVEQIREKGITDSRVLEAIGKVPRHLFIEARLTVKEMYEDVPVGIAQGQSISQPFTVAYQTQLLEVKPKERILEIGTGSGYQSAVLFEMGAEVFTIERQRRLYAETKKRLNHLGYSGLHMYYGDGYDGLSELAPFDKIIITAAAPDIPPRLIQQLAVGGIMVIPLNGEIQRMFKITKVSETEIKEEDFGHFRFVPLLRGIEE